MTMDNVNLQECRLCHNAAKPIFEHQVLGKHNVQYYICDNCDALMTEDPYWLEEAYSSNLCVLDVGAVARVMANFSALMCLSRIFSIKSSIDFGGSDGLLTPMLRDYGLKAFSEDKYAKATYARGYTAPEFMTPDLISAFEVFEHMAKPIDDLDYLFGKKPKIIIFSTELYSGQGKNWSYLAPEEGQHILFHTKKSLKMVGDKYKYKFIIVGRYKMFVSQDSYSAARVFLLKCFLRIPVLSLIRALLMFRYPSKNFMNDFHELQKGLQDKS